MRFISKHKWFLAFTAVFAVSASIVFWGTWSNGVGFIAPDDAIFFPYDYEDTLLNWRNMFFTAGKAHPLDFLWSGLIISPVSCSQLKYVVPAFLSAVALAWFLRGKGLSRLASYAAGLFLAFSGYWLTLFSAGHGNWFIWMSYGVFAFGLIDRAVSGKGFRYWLLLGLSVAWASFYAPDVWLLFSVFTFFYLVYRLIAFRVFPIKGLISAFFVFLIIASPSIYHAFSNDLSGRDKQIEEASGSVMTGNVEDENEKRWIFVTNWSMPLEDTLEFIIPRFQGDTSCPYTLSINKEKGTSLYTGALGRPINSKEGNYRQHSLYVGFITCLFALAAIFFLPKSRKNDDDKINFVHCDIAFFLIGAIVFWLFSLGRNCETVYRLVYALPFGDYLRAPVKWHHLTEFCIAVLSGFGVEYVLRTFSSRKWVRNVVAILVLAGTVNLAWQAHYYCAPVDYSNAVKKKCSSKLAVVPIQQLQHPSVRRMVQEGYIVPMADWLGNPNAKLIQFLEPVRPLKPVSPKRIPLILGLMSVISAISVLLFSFGLIKKRKSP